MWSGLHFYSKYRLFVGGSYIPPHWHQGWPRNLWCPFFGRIVIPHCDDVRRGHVTCLATELSGEVKSVTFWAEFFKAIIMFPTSFFLLSHSTGLQKGLVLPPGPRMKSTSRNGHVIWMRNKSVLKPLRFGSCSLPQDRGLRWATWKLLPRNKVLLSQQLHHRTKKTTPNSQDMVLAFRRTESRGMAIHVMWWRNTEKKGCLCSLERQRG